MCGIYGSVQGLEVERVLRAMHYRGPDARRVETRGGFALGHVRLAIVDTKSEEAVQPRRTRKGNVLAFNGEIYNYRHLDAQAESEVQLLEALIEAGVDPRQVCDGDYAIVHWNPSQQLLTLWRDRFGACQLYFQVLPHVAVSSEARRLENPIAVHAFQRVRIGVGERAGFVERDTFTHYGVTCSAGVSEHTLAPLIADAVLSRARHTDRGFSVIVSGGLDSLVIAAAVRAVGLHPAEALVALPHNAREEEARVQAICRHLGIPLCIVTVTSQWAQEQRAAIEEHLECGRTGIGMNELRWRMALRTWAVAGVCTSRVLLSGEGADEVVEGYPPHTTRDTPQWEKVQHQLAAVRSLATLNLDITHKLGLAHSVEVRSPFLASTLSYLLLSARRAYGKQWLRWVLREWGVPERLFPETKWSGADVAMGQTGGGW